MRSYGVKNINNDWLVDECNYNSWFVSLLFLEESDYTLMDIGINGSRVWEAPFTAAEWTDFPICIGINLQLGFKFVSCNWFFKRQFVFKYCEWERESNSAHEKFILETLFLLQPLSLSPRLSPSSPIASPSKDKYGDRFIPSRAGASWQINFNISKVSRCSICLFEYL